MKSELERHVPVWLARQVAAESAPPDTFSFEHSHAAIMMVDVSGFTALGERLAARGSAGAEALWRIVNTFFGRTLDLIHADGGEVVRFAGDALIVEWLVDDTATLADATARAAALGLALQASLDGYDTGEATVLRFRVAIAAGRVLSARLGGIAGRWEALVGGEPFGALAAAAVDAGIGEVVLARDAGELIADRADRQTLPSGNWRLTRMRSSPARLPTAFPTLQADQLRALRRYIPRSTLKRIDSDHGQWLGELRLITTVFVAIHGLDYVAPGIAQTLHELLRGLQQAVYQFEGSVNQFLVDDKGTVMLAAWGLPGCTHEDDAQLAVRAALGMQEAVDRLGFRCSIGVSTGRGFCGLKGDARRSEYGVLGSQVTLAARLMQHANGEILCDESTERVTRGVISYATPVELHVKGRAQAVSAYRPRGEGKGKTRGGSALVGREAEREAVTAHLDALVAGRGGVLLLEGEAGIGKSTLLESLRHEAASRGVRPLCGAGDAIETKTPYHALRPIFAELMGLESAWNAEGRVYAALAWFENHPELRHVAPLFNPALRLALPENETTASMEGEARGASTRAAYIKVLSMVSPLLVVIDDLQWLDSSSLDLVRLAIGQLPNALFVFATRPTEEEPSSAYEQLARQPAAHLKLKPLRQTEIDTLVCGRLRASSLSREVSQVIWERADGSPFYSEELAAAMLEEQLVTVTDGVVRLSQPDSRRAALPATLQGIIATRLDQLAPVELLSLKVASVIGRRFLCGMVMALYPRLEERPQVEDALRTAQRRELTVLSAPEPHLAYLFKHVITQQVVYEQLLFQQRKELHRAAAAWYEAGNEGEVAPIYPLIAHHWEQAEDRERAINALEAAGEQAFASFANREAISFIARARDLDAAGEPSPRIRRGRWHRVMGEAYSRLGLITESVEQLSTAVQLMGYALPRNPFSMVAALLGQVVRQVWRRYRGLGKLAAGDPKPVLNAVNTFAELGLMAYYHGNTLLTLYTTLKAINLAETVEQSPEVARLKAAMAVLSSGIPIHSAAENYSLEAIATAEKFEHQSSTARAHQYRGAFLIGMGRWDEIPPHADAAMAASKAIGNDRGIEEALNLQIYREMAQARYDAVYEKATLQAESARKREDGQMLFWSQIHQVETKWRRGEIDAAAQVLATMDYAGQRDATIVTRFWGLHVHLLVAASRLDEALELAKEHLFPQKRPTSFIENRAYTAAPALELALWTRDGPGQGRRRAAKRACHWLETYAQIYPEGRSSMLYYEGKRLCLLEKPDRGRALLTESAAVARAAGERYEEMLAHRALAEIAVGSEAEQHVQQALALQQAITPRS